MDKILNYKIGIIGYGNFGKVISQYLFPQSKQIIYSRGMEQKKLLPTATLVDSIQELVEASDIIIPAVPIRSFEHVIKEIVPFLKEGQIIMDVCSVKEYPVTIMNKYIPKNVNIIATHPMFGPNSINKRDGNITGLNFIINNIGCNQDIYTTMKNYFKTLNLNVIDMEPAEHDRLAAYSQFFAMIIGQCAQNLDVKKTPIDTLGASAIIDALGYMGADRMIIEDMITYNTYCKEVLEKMIKTITSLDKVV